MREITVTDMDFARKIAGTYASRNPRVCPNELESAAMEGLLDAATKFDESFDYPWDKYRSIRVNGAVQDRIRKEAQQPAGITGKPVSETVTTVSIEYLRSLAETHTLLMDTYPTPSEVPEIISKVLLDMDHYTVEDELVMIDRLRMFLQYLQSVRGDTRGKLYALYLGNDPNHVAKVFNCSVTSLYELATYHAVKIREYINNMEDFTFRETKNMEV